MKKRQSRKVVDDISDYDLTVNTDDDDDNWSESSNKPVKRRKINKKQPQDARTDVAVVTQFPDKHPSSRHVLRNVQLMRDSLLAWYEQVHDKRGMPWRKRCDSSMTAEQRSQRAYEVWISEIMLQQTQVATVIPYYDRWMNKFPTIKALADSDIESVNALWKGLGYYSRAARLLSGAQKVRKEYGGLFPSTAKDMMANIPGIGRYSAGAISSIAYNHCEPVLDGNVNRLMSRVLALYANPKGKSALDMLWAGATSMITDADRPGDINQALIELGSTVCKPRDPDCVSCPLQKHCGAYLETKGLLPEELDIEELCSLCEDAQLDEDVGVTKYPMKVERKKAREEVDIVCVVEWRSPLGARHFLLVKRPEQGLLAGLHEFPTHADVKEPDSPSTVKKVGLTILNDMLECPPASEKKAGIKSNDCDGDLHIVQMKPAGDVLHIFSHIRKTYRIQWICLEGNNDDSEVQDLEEPPSLNLEYAPPSAKQSKGTAIKSKKPKKASVKDAVKKEAGSSPRLRWVKYEDVQDANIGTGVVKVWTKVNELWVD